MGRPELGSSAVVFRDRLINRQVFPQRWALIIEDDIEAQIGFLRTIAEMFGPQGSLLTHVAPSGAHAANIFFDLPERYLREPLFALLDHDMPVGNGADFMLYYKESKFTFPVCAVSGIAENNKRLLELGAVEAAEKSRSAGQARLWMFLRTQWRRLEHKGVDLTLDPVDFPLDPIDSGLEAAPGHACGEESGS